MELVAAAAALAEVVAAFVVEKWEKVAAAVGLWLEAPAGIAGTGFVSSPLDHWEIGQPESCWPVWAAAAAAGQPEAAAASGKVIGSE